ncbi:hypothetical protein I350_04537 [Cryptococcus amylolentus CBS 6273]|uniref:Uncharacterized protein n=1 Tax=Cryptococcus amylolentus CBS 6273 TaxID=1296118 RepID=A0A1E3JXK0_9TREE|nr:hypothetical protein I350_04537 [Cryptococcus amylolentus CBS 6273]
MVVTARSEQRQLGEDGGDLAFEGKWESDDDEKDSSRRAKVAKAYGLRKDGSVKTLKKLTAAGRLIMMKAGIITLDKTFIDWNNGEFQQKLNTEHYPIRKMQLLKVPQNYQRVNKRIEARDFGFTTAYLSNALLDTEPPAQKPIRPQSWNVER